MKTVELNISNYTKCLCPVCPVEADSSCLYNRQGTWRQDRQKVGEMLAEYPGHPEIYEMPMDQLEQQDPPGDGDQYIKPAPANMRELFCSKAVGKSSCQDLESQRQCQCADCQVFADSGLGSGYFCVHGSA